MYMKTSINLNDVKLWFHQLAISCYIICWRVVLLCPAASDSVSCRCWTATTSSSSKSSPWACTVPAPPPEAPGSELEVLEEEEETTTASSAGAPATVPGTPPTRGERASWRPASGTSPLPPGSTVRCCWATARCGQSDVGNNGVRLLTGRRMIGQDVRALCIRERRVKERKRWKLRNNPYPVTKLFRSFQKFHAPEKLKKRNGSQKGNIAVTVAAIV